MKTLLTSISLLILCLFPVDAMCAPSNPDFSQYRCYAVAGGAHICDETTTREAFAEGQESSVAGTTPINWLPFIKVLLVISIRN